MHSSRFIFTDLLNSYRYFFGFQLKELNDKIQLNKQSKITAIGRFVVKF